MRYNFQDRNWVPDLILSLEVGNCASNRRRDNPPGHNLSLVFKPNQSHFEAYRIIMPICTVYYFKLFNIFLDLLNWVKFNAIYNMHFFHFMRIRFTIKC